MVKKVICIGVVLMLIFSLSACSSSGDTVSEPEENVQEEMEAQPEETEEETDVIDADSSEETGASEEQTPVSITVYYSNNDATAFDSSEVEIPVLSPEEILNALTEKGVITADIQVRSLKETEADGEKALELDLNDAFASYVANMGVSGEYYVIGGICNTFLDAYGCERLKITVEGDILTTGHAEYPGYMTEFQ